MLGQRGYPMVVPPERFERIVHPVQQAAGQVNTAGQGIGD